MAYTKGPWKLVTAPYKGHNKSDDSFLGTIIGPNNEVIYDGPFSFHALKGDDNARLMTASPKMLEALEAIASGDQSQRVNFCIRYNIHKGISNLSPTGLQQHIAQSVIREVKNEA